MEQFISNSLTLGNIFRVLLYSREVSQLLNITDFVGCKVDNFRCLGTRRLTNTRPVPPSIGTKIGCTPPARSLQHTICGRTSFCSPPKYDFFILPITEDILFQACAGYMLAHGPILGDWSRADQYAHDIIQVSLEIFSIDWGKMQLDNKLCSLRRY